MRGNFWVRLILGASAFLFYSCSNDDPKQDPISEPIQDEPIKQSMALVFESNDERRAWLEKVSRRVRGGKSLSMEEMNQLLPMSPEMAVDEMMKDSAFVGTVLDFNMYYLGFKDDRSVRQSNNQFSAAMDHPSALGSAIALAKNENYLQLWRYETPLYLPPLEKARLPDEQMEQLAGSSGPNQQSEKYTQAEIRQIIYAATVARLDQTISELSKPDVSPESACSLVSNQDDIGLEATGVSSRLTTAIFNQEFLASGIECFISRKTDIPRARAAFVRVRGIMPRLIEVIESLAPEVYKMESIADIRQVDVTEFGVSNATVFTDQGFWFNLQNSSTNLNRRRAAFVLKRYFCDDLTPINIAVPEQHGTDIHAASPSCAACHYKLDPMAGFFKDIGFFGIDFSRSEQIIFDDLARRKHTDYVQFWKSDDTDREWNIGYIRSLTDHSRNHYGEGLRGLFEVIQKAPETKQCLVKRMLEYFVDENQVFDAEYVKSLSDEFIEASEVNASEAYRQTVRRILTGQTFAQRDPISQKCYDFAIAQSPKNRPPCAVAAMLKRNCVSCHGAVVAAGDLNLENWTALTDGTQSFPHFRNGQQVSGAETMRAVIERLASTDPNRRMPLNQSIPDYDRDALFNWANHQLNGFDQRAGDE